MSGPQNQINKPPSEFPRKPYKFYAGGEGMKNYIKPVFEAIELKTEERLAGSCGGWSTGSCPVPEE